MQSTIEKPPKPKFSENIAIGEEAEQRIVSIFMSQQCMAERYRKGLDFSDIWLQVGELNFNVEVKNEDEYSYSPNICIETQQGFMVPKVDSGIFTSSSQVYIHTLGKKAALYRTNEMLKYLFREERNLIQYYVSEFARSDNGNAGYRLPMRLVEECWWFDRCLMSQLPSSPVFRILKGTRHERR